MSIEILDKVMNEMTDAIAAETDPLKAEAIAKEFESKIDAAEKEMEAAIEKELKEADEALEKEFEASQVVDEIEEEVEIENPNSHLTKPERCLLEEIYESDDLEVLAKKYAKKEFVELAKSLDVEYKNLKEIELIELIKKTSD